MNMKRVSKIIFDALAARRSIHLPEVGYLEVRRRRAKKISDTRIIPPQNVVTFTTDDIAESDSVVSLLTSEGMPREEAHAIYNEWLAAARKEDGSITIERVGEIKDGKIVVAAPLHNAINPDNEEIITMEKQTKCVNCGSLWAWILVGILSAVLIAGVIWCCKKGLFTDCGKDERIEVVEVIVPEEPVATAPATSEPAPVEEPAAVEPAPAFHVIAGSFAIESNADKLIKKVKRTHPELNPEKIVQPSTGYWMVSIFSSPNQRTAYNTMHKYWDIDLYLWIYEQE